MAQRKKDVVDACKFELTDAEIKSLASILDQASKFSPLVEDCRMATRWRQFFLASKTMKRSEFNEVEVLDN